MVFAPIPAPHDTRQWEQQTIAGACSSGRPPRFATNNQAIANESGMKGYSFCVQVGTIVAQVAHCSASFHIQYRRTRPQSARLQKR